jgi:hypothetical protein
MRSPSHQVDIPASAVATAFKCDPTRASRPWRTTRKSATRWGYLPGPSKPAPLITEAMISKFAEAMRAGCRQ